jgi:nucleoside-diphosphate-sugar epimerase
MFSENKLYRKDITFFASNNRINWDKLKNKAILITGATGLIGTFLIDLLMYRNEYYKNNITIYAIGRNFAKAENRFKEYFGSSFFCFYKHDILYPLDLNKSIDFIIHGASYTHPMDYAKKPIDTILLSLDGLKNIFDFAILQKIKSILFLSTVEIYGENRGDTEKFTEDYCGYINCNTLRAGYPEGKRAAEALCQAYIQENNLRITIARCCRTYGPTMNNDDSKVIMQFIRNAIAEENIILKSNGSQQYSYCYVADMCIALLFLLINGSNGDAYNISDSLSDISIYEIAKILSEYIKKDIIYEQPSSLESIGFSRVSRAILDSTKINKLGWTAEYSIQKGLIRTIEILKGEKIQNAHRNFEEITRR